MGGMARTRGGGPRPTRPPPWPMQRGGGGWPEPADAVGAPPPPKCRVAGGSAMLPGPNHRFVGVGAIASGAAPAPKGERGGTGGGAHVRCGGRVRGGRCPRPDPGRRGAHTSHASHGGARFGNGPKCAPLRPSPAKRGPCLGRGRGGGGASLGGFRMDKALGLRLKRPDQRPVPEPPPPPPAQGG